MLHADGEQSALVVDYFDQIAAGYQHRFCQKNPFHSHFFRQRLGIALDSLDLDGRRILDIGAGTGSLYDEIMRRRFAEVDYFACDISPAMLAQSSIPVSRRFVGKANSAALPSGRFDFIFSLGVTTYQSPADLRGDWRFVADHLADDGTAVISFTNRGSLDHYLRAVLKLARPFLRRGVLAQSFSTFAYRVDDAIAMARAVGLEVKRIEYLNHAFSPFNVLLPRTSVRLANLIRRMPAALLPVLSADFIVFISKR